MNLKNPQRIFFITGMAGVGKSYLGRNYALRKGVEFIDTDEYIENESGLTVADFFRKYGEDAFRLQEQKVLRSLIDKKGEKEIMVVSVGGGLPISTDNRSLMRKLGKIVWMKGKPHLIFQRLSDTDKKNRPKILVNAGYEAFMELYRVRINDYMQCHHELYSEGDLERDIAQFHLLTLEA